MLASWVFLKELLAASSAVYMKNLKPIFFENSVLPIWLSKIVPIKVAAFSFFIFVWSRNEMGDRLKNHETIHFQQQLELLFVGQWLLYGLFYLINLWKTKGDGKLAYTKNPFEIEAYKNDYKKDYLANRKRYSWIKYI